MNNNNGSAAPQNGGPPEPLGSNNLNFNSTVLLSKAPNKQTQYQTEILESSV
jgi:hypothetical protein